MAHGPYTKEVRVLHRLFGCLFRVGKMLRSSGPGVSDAQIGLRSCALQLVVCIRVDECEYAGNILGWKICIGTSLLSA